MVGTNRQFARLPIVHTLRGLAALAVVFAHFFYANANLNTGAVRHVARFGTLGVQVFFVISGFILPYSLWKSHYKLSDYGTFVLKRIIRLDPPYFAAIALALAVGSLAALSPGYLGGHYSFSLSQVLLHFAYLNAFFGKPWIVIVFWTLAIEFQYYLTLGLLYPLLESKNGLVFPALAVAAVLSQWAVFKIAFLPYHWPFFFLGIAVFRRKAGIADAFETVLWLLAFSAWAAFGTGAVGAGAGLASAACIFWAHYQSRVTNFLGDISYSLYLIHQPIGNRISNLGGRFAHNPVQAVLAALLATAGSICCAYFMWKYIELPSQRWANGIRYRERKTDFSAAEVTRVPQPASLPISVAPHPLSTVRSDLRE